MSIIFSLFSHGHVDTYDRSESEENGNGPLRCYEFPTKLQDPVLSARRYRVVQ